MAIQKQPALTEERIHALRAEIDRFIDERVEEIRKTCEGVPAASIRLSITRGLGCQCAAFLHLKKQEKAA